MVPPRSHRPSSWPPGHHSRPLPSPHTSRPVKTTKSHCSYIPSTFYCSLGAGCYHHMLGILPQSPLPAHNLAFALTHSPSEGRASFPECNCWSSRVEQVGWVLLRLPQGLPITFTAPTNSFMGRSCLPLQLPQSC